MEKSIVCYGFPKEKFERVKDELIEYDCKFINPLSILSMVLTISIYLISPVKEYLQCYLIVIAVFALVYFFTRQGNKLSSTVKEYVIVGYLVILSIVVIYASVYFCLESQGVILPACLIIFGLIMSGNLVRTYIFIIADAVVFSMLSYYMKPIEYAANDIRNTVFFGVVALVIHYLVVKNRITELIKTADEKDNENKNNYMMQLSHDIRTPITAVIGLSNVALEEISDKKSVEYFKKINQSGKYILELINDILDMTRLQKNSIILNPVYVNAEEFIKNIMDIIRVQALEKNHMLETDLGEIKYQYQKFDRMRVQQVLINVLNNAVKYTPNGGKIKYIYRQVIDENGKPWCHHEVEDNGVGMSEDFQKNIFKPFSQEINSETVKSTGSGLGLSICYNLVKIMGGTIKINSEVGKGTKFVIDIPTHPVSREEYMKAKSELDSYDYSVLEGKHILICEDHPVNALVLTKTLELKNMKVKVAQNGVEAVDILEASEENFYDAVFMDIQMPIMDGITAAGKIRNSERNDLRNIPIIAMSGNAYDEDREESLKAGMNEHLVKPVDNENVYRALINILK